jgi:hypothetical protein
MDTLHIDLQDGFQGHTVTVDVDGQTAYRQADVNTDLTISRADAFKTQISTDLVLIKLTAEPGNIRGECKIAPRINPFLAVSIVPGGGVRFTPSTSPFRYM